VSGNPVVDDETAPRARTLLYVVNDSWFLASHRFEIVRAAVAAGYEVHIAAHRDESIADFEALGCHFHDWALAPRGTGPLTEFRALASLASIIRRVRPDVLHLVTIKPLVYGGLLARVLRVPAVVFAVAGMGNVFVAKNRRDRIIKGIASAAYDIVLRHPNLHVIVQNEPDRQRFAEGGLVPPDNVTLTRGSGVDLERFGATPEPAGAPLVLLASRMLWTKGVGEFVEAARSVRARRPEVRFALAGRIDPENLHSVLETDVARWVEEGVIEWRGRCDDMPTLLAESHVVCLPTYYGEGLPKVLIEACAIGRAIVCTDWPGCREIVRDGVNGLLVPPRNADALTDALWTLVEDGERRGLFAHAARAIAEDGYSVETVVARTLGVYARALPDADVLPAATPGTLR